MKRLTDPQARVLAMLADAPGGTAGVLSNRTDADGMLCATGATEALDRAGLVRIAYNWQTCHHLVTLTDAGFAAGRFDR